MQESKIKIIAMHENLDDSGNISTGWVLSLLDLAAGIAVKEFTGKRSVTIAMDKICFKKPILVGDLLNCYAHIVKVGKTSINLKLRIDIKRLCPEGYILIKDVSSSEATFVSLDENGNKVIITEELKQTLNLSDK